MKVKSIISGSLGNVLEWYDFGLFAIYSPIFGRIFFPEKDPHTALIATLSIFAVGFICRPIGSLLFGYLGDRKGRVIALRLSILMISLPTLLIGFLPTYSQVGVLAPVFLTIIRIWQGISLGGEYSGNIIYLAESAPADYRATFTSFASTGANLGILLATLIGTICFFLFPNEQWGWRLPYLVSGLLSIFVYLTRLQLDETKVFNYLKKNNLLARNPIKQVFQNNIPQMLRTIGLVCMGSTFYYFCFIYLPAYLVESRHFSSLNISSVMTVFFLMMLIFVPLSGLICDRLGRRKMLLFNAAVVMIIAVPGYYFLQTKALLIVLLVMFIFTISSSLEQATTSVAVVENYPTPSRYTGLSLSYNIGNGFLGGTVPLVCAELTERFHTTLAPAYYIAICALVTWLVAYFFVPETRLKNLSF